MTETGRLLFVDSNVLVESLFLRRSAAAGVMDLAIQGVFRVATCRQVVDDVERAVLSKLQKFPENLDAIVGRWEALKNSARLEVVADEALDSADRIYHEYIALMRHKADIPILAAAIRLNPDAILSGNRNHFNDAVSQKSGILICSCGEFLELIGRHTAD